MRLSRVLVPVVVGVALAWCAGCKLFDTKCKQGQNCFSTAAAFAEDLGGACTQDAECKPALYCIARVCSAKHDTPNGKKCRLTAECGDADYCGDQRLCKPAGVATVGMDCVNTGNCKSGLVCQAADLSQLGTVSLTDLASTSASCKKGGDRQQGEVCSVVSDCLAGLSCLPGDDGKTHCTDPQPSPVDLPVLPVLWSGPSCPQVKDSDPTESYFHVPRGGEPQTEFYSLPFPNDVRRKNGHIDLSGHPVPPAGFGLPYVERLVDAAQDADGFSTNPVVFFRFSKPYAFKSVQCIDGGVCAVRIVDVTPSSPEYNQKASIDWKTTSGPLSNYVCPHWLALRRPPGEPLRAHTTYAAVITKDITPDAGGSYQRGADFDAMLGSDPPSNSELAAAYEQYAPLRAWLADAGENPDDILNAAVFTTQDPEAMIQKLAAKVQSEAVPTLSALTLCEGDATKSPCDDGNGRGQCHAANDAFAELHGRIELPIFQKGTLPYLNPEDGGEIELDGNNVPIVQDHQAVCFGLSVPKVSAPKAGYPVLVFAHGTGGSFADELGSGGFAEVAATGNVPSALFAIDLPEHGDRRGASTDTPEKLFYNYLNPRAARDNVLQGSADLLSVVRFIQQSGGIDAADSPTGNAVKLDPGSIALMGHSQGATHSALMNAYAPAVSGIVLSGNGGYLALSLLSKTSPSDVASVLPVALLDADDNFKLAGGGYNAALAILQTAFDRADPINYARHLQRQPTMQVPTGQHAFVTFGLEDTYASVDTQAAFARAARLTVVTPVLQDLTLPTAPPPLTANQTIAGSKRTVGLRQYAPKNGEDGHFVAVDQGQDGRPDVERFLQQLLAGQVPNIGE